MTRDVSARPARVQLRVAPGGRTSCVIGRYGDAWKIRVRAAPEQGKANEQVRALVAGIAGVPVDAVTIVTGAASRDKLVSVRGTSSEELARRLDAAAEK